MIKEDFERESLKDFIYLQEELELLKQEILEEKRLAALVFVIDKDKIHTNEPTKNNVLPF